MKGRFLIEEVIEEFEKHLELEEKSAQTVEKYARDVRVFMRFAAGSKVNKETAIAFKQHIAPSETQPIIDLDGGAQAKKIQNFP